MGTQVCSNEGPHPFPRGDDYTKSKNTLTKFWKYTLEPLSQFYINLVQSILKWWKFEFVQKKDHVLFQRDIITKQQKYIEFKNLLHKFSITGPISFKHGTKHTWVKETQGFTNRDHSIFKNEIVPGFFLNSISSFWYNHLCLLIWTSFSCERCGPWASC